MATALFLQLEKTFSEERLFMDVEGGIPPGYDFVDILEKQVAECQVVLAMIGKGWLTASDLEGRRRLDNPDDFVRIEIELAMRLGKLIIPVLVNNAEMPRASELPDSLKPLVRRNAVRITQARFRPDAQGLVDSIAHTLETAQERRRREDAEAEEQESAKDAMASSKDPATLMQFLKLYPDDPRIGQVQLRLRARLKELMVISNDPETLRTFLKLYPGDPDVAAVRTRLRALQIIRPGQQDN